MENSAHQIVGVVSHILAGGILFEFKIDDKAQLGIVKPRDVLVQGSRLTPGMK